MIHPSDIAVTVMTHDATAESGTFDERPIGLDHLALRVTDRDELHRWAAHFDAMDQWLSRFDGLLTFGRQGLFAHDNTHHALTMAYAAADCLKSDGAFDRALWERYRREFESHVVED